MTNAGKEVEDDLRTTTKVKTTDMIFLTNGNRDCKNNLQVDSIFF